MGLMLQLIGRISKIKKGRGYINHGPKKRTVGFCAPTVPKQSVWVQSDGQAPIGAPPPETPPPVIDCMLDLYFHRRPHLWVKSRGVKYFFEDRPDSGSPQMNVLLKIA